MDDVGRCRPPARARKVAIAWYLCYSLAYISYCLDIDMVLLSTMYCIDCLVSCKVAIAWYLTVTFVGTHLRQPGPGGRRGGALAWALAALQTLVNHKSLSVSKNLLLDDLCA